MDTHSLALQINRSFGPRLRPGEFLKGERLYNHLRLEHMYVRHNGNWLAVSEVSAIFDGWYSDYAPSPRVWNLTSPLFDDLPTARRRVDVYFDAVDRFADLVASAGTESGGSWDCDRLQPNALQGFPNDYRRYNTIHGGVRTHYWIRCRMEAAVTMLALHEYHRKYGHYPDKLEELVPVYLPRLPLDYADLAPLRYRRQEDSYLLHSIMFHSVSPDGEEPGGFTKTEREKYDP